jgi:hypothetical protein
MGLKGSPTHAVTYEAVRVPAGDLLGEQGHGLKQTLQTLDGGRIGIGALSVGLGAGCIRGGLLVTLRNGLPLELPSQIIRRSNGCWQMLLPKFRLRA